MLVIRNFTKTRTQHILSFQKHAVESQFLITQQTHHTQVTYFLGNGTILVEFKTLQYVVESEAEVEVCGVFHNSQIEILIRNTLEALLNPQKPTPIRTDNSTATGFVYENIHMKRSNIGICVTIELDIA